jgi:hypothetical protein
MLSNDDAAADRALLDTAGAAECINTSGIAADGTTVPLRLAISTYRMQPQRQIDNADRIIISENAKITVGVHRDPMN